MTVSKANGFTELAITFDEPFANAVDAIVVSIASATTDTAYNNLKVITKNHSVTGFTARILNSSAVTGYEPWVNWIAIGY